MTENAFTAHGVSALDEPCDGKEREGRLMMISGEKSAIPRKKRSARVGMSKEERMMVESPLELLASVTIKSSELDERIPLEKKKIEFLFPTEQNRKKMKRSLNLGRTEAIPMKKKRDKVGALKESAMGESPMESLLYVALELPELSQKIPFKKRKREFSSRIAEIPKSNKKKKTLNLEATEKKEKKAIPKPAVLEVSPMGEAMAEKIRRMGGEGVVLVHRKQLCKTDLSKGNSRLSIPRRQRITEFLSETEKTILKEKIKKKMRGIEVLVIDPRLEELNLCLKMWKMTNNFVYNLITNWNQLVAENDLKKGDTVQLWAFRVEERRRRGLSDLCFALAKVEDDNNGGAADDGSSTSTVTTHGED